MKRSTPLRSYRPSRRPGNRAMTKSEVARTAAAKTCRCIPCLVWAEAGRMPMDDIAVLSDLNHCKSGNIRRGHDKSYAGCGWHHRGIAGDGWTHNRMREHFGPSLTDGSRLFRDTYGDDDELIARQNLELGL